MAHPIVGAAALALGIAMAIGLAYLDFSTPLRIGHEVRATVLSIGMRSAGRVAGGDLPILTARLPDGSVRDVPATWADVGGCEPGRRISLLQQGFALRVGRPGCVATR